MEKKKRIGLLIPCFNEEEAIRRTIDLTEAVLSQAPKQIEYIYIFVDDGSIDNTQHELEAISTVLPRECRILVFSRNFGKEAAMLAGLEEAKDLDGIIFMDADGQDPPEAILRMSELFLTEEYDDIYAQRSGRNDSSFLKKKMIEWHYKLLNHFSSFPIAEDVGDYRLLNRKAMDEVLRLQERCRYTKGLFAFIGLRKKAVQIFRTNRIGGTSKWNLKKQIAFAVDSLVNFTNLPYLLAIWGFVLSLFFSVVLFSCAGYSIIPWGTALLFAVFVSVTFVLCELVVFMKLLMVLILETKCRPHYILLSRKKKPAGN